MSDYGVYVKKIDAISPHTGADKLEIAHIGGWKTIVAKDLYKVGQHVIFVQPDILLPQEVVDRWEISYLKGHNGRVGTIKLRGEWSEGLILTNKDNFPLGTDVSGFYGMVKYEPPPPIIKGTKPKIQSRRADHRFVRYTDIEDIKNWMSILEEGEEVIITEKIHGSNFRAGRLTREMTKFEYIVHKLSKGRIGRTWEFMLGSHNIQLEFGVTVHDYYGRNIYHEVASAYRLDKILPVGYIFFGEVFGAGVQSMYHYGHLADRELAFFDVYDVAGKKYLDWEDQWLMLAELTLPVVPFLYKGPWNPGLIYEHSMGDSTVYPQLPREGCVIRPIVERTHPKLGRVILKAISPAYLEMRGRTEGH